MTTINYVATVKVSTGEIESIDFCGGGNWPDEGPIENSDPPQERFWIDEETWTGKDANEILEEWYRKEGAWHHRGRRPNNYYMWNAVDFAWELSSENLWKDIRRLRLQKLQECDWTQVKDVALATHEVLAWQSYRNALRNVPEEYSWAVSPDDITWPLPPQ